MHGSGYGAHAVRPVHGRLRHGAGGSVALRAVLPDDGDEPRKDDAELEAIEAPLPRPRLLRGCGCGCVVEDETWVA